MPAKTLEDLPSVDASLARWAEVKSTHALVKFVFVCDLFLLIAAHLLVVNQFFAADLPRNVTVFASVTAGDALGAKVSEILSRERGQ